MGVEKEKLKEERSEGEGPEEVEEKPTCCGCRFPLLIAVLQLLLGVGVAVVAFFQASISPSLLARETPYWAGIILCVVALFGFVLFAVTYLPDEKTFLQFISKVLYFLLCSVGVALSLLAMSFAIHHYLQVSGFQHCEAVGKEDCRCTMTPDDPVARTFHFAGAGDCEVITGTLPLYFLLQMLLNLVQALVCMAGAFVMWKHRYQVFFTGLQISAPGWQKV